MYLEGFYETEEEVSMRKYFMGFRFFFGGDGG